MSWKAAKPKEIQGAICCQLHLSGLYCRWQVSVFLDYLLCLAAQWAKYTETYGAQVSGVVSLVMFL